MNPKSLLIGCVVLLLLISCKTNLTSNSKNNPEWIWGNTFTTDYTPFINSEIGGADFISFVNKNQINLKMGCMLSRVKAEFKDDTISIEDPFLKTHKTFTLINNSYLMDEFGAQWKVKTTNSVPFKISNLNWKIVSLNNETISKDTADFYLNLNSSTSRFESKAGCNQLVGEFQINDNHITFSKISMTKMFCIDNAKTENDYIDILNSVNNFVVLNNTTLILKKDTISKVKFMLVQ
jgi:heat shock protein HslJ